MAVDFASMDYAMGGNRSCAAICSGKRINA